MHSVCICPDAITQVVLFEIIRRNGIGPMQSRTVFLFGIIRYWARSTIHLSAEFMEVASIDSVRVSCFYVALQPLPCQVIITAPKFMKQLFSKEVYILIVKGTSIATANAFKKLKHGTITETQQVCNSEYISTCIKQACIFT